MQNISNRGNTESTNVVPAPVPYVGKNNTPTSNLNQPVSNQNRTVSDQNLVNSDQKHTNYDPKQPLSSQRPEQDVLSFLQDVSKELKSSIPATPPTLVEKIDNYIRKLGAGLVTSHKVFNDREGRSYAVPK